jgi:GNAT superfamily N-acetyltransferase
MDYEKTIGDYLISTDKTKLQVEKIHRYLSEESYWAQNIPVHLVLAAIKGSICFGVYAKGEQIGFARVITDRATFAYLADVYVKQEHRGKGLSKELMKFILNYDGLTSLRRFMLATKDAHGLYKQFGFSSLAEPQRFMEIKAFENYKQ